MPRSSRRQDSSSIERGPFGAFVQSLLARRLVDCVDAAHRVVLVGPPAGEVGGQRSCAPNAAQPGTLIVQGGNDKRVPLRALFEWARPQSQPVVAVPGADHFFTGRLPVLRALTIYHLRS